jgi:RNA:NAD 2'-phosphotransferase (TPT1/KptA family)
VHPSYDRDITVEAARRKSRDVVLLEIVVEKARALGVGFYRSADARIVLADALPAEALVVIEPGSTRPRRSSDIPGSSS